MRFANPFKKKKTVYTEEDIKNVKTEYDLPLSLWLVIYYSKLHKWFYKKGVDLNGVVVMLLIVGVFYFLMWLLSLFA